MSGFSELRASCAKHPEIYFALTCPACYSQRDRPRPRGVFYLGEQATVAEWCRRLGLKLRTVRARLGSGWTVRQAFETPKWQRP